MFVAVGILQLVEKGQLSLSDTIGELLNIDWCNIDKDITVEQLLTHKSGIPDYFNDDNYGYGIWLNKNSVDNSLPYFTGSDPGVSFISTYKLDENVTITVVSNFGDNVWKMLRKIREELYSK